MLNTGLNLTVTRDGQVNRRGFLQTLGGAAAAAGVAQIGVRNLLAAQADELKKRGKSMILLWMDGAPSQFDTFNPKVGSEFQGPAGAIKTNVPGIEFSEFWPKSAQVMDKIALIRSMKSSEADHFRAIKLLKTGYPVTPAVRYPTWGSVVAMQRHDELFDLPAYVRVGKPRIATRDVDHGVLGTRYAGFKIDEPGTLPADVLPRVTEDILRRRLSLTDRLDAEFAVNGGEPAVREKKEIYDRTARFVFSPRLGVFDLTKEPESVRDEYGRSTFGQGCLLARRLIEAGVSFVEVYSTGSVSDQGWDTHSRGFVENPKLCNETDPGYAALLKDLADRGMLENTLVVWMGEFGRTPKFKTDGGREHYAEGWIAALSGAGVRGGQVIGATDKDGVKITDRPVGVSDLFQSFCHALDIEPEFEYTTPDGRPLKLVEGGKVVAELFG